MKSNFVWMLLGQGVFSAALWLNLMVLAHLGDAEQVGYYSFALSIVTPIALLSALSLRTVYIAEQDERYGFADYFHIRKLSVPVASTIIALWAFFENSNVTQALVIVLIGAAKMAENMSDISYAIPHKEEALKRVVISMLLRACLGSGAFVLTYWLTRNIVLACLIYALCWWAVYLVYDSHRMIEPWSPLWNDRNNYQSALIKPLVLLALPMGLSSFINAAAVSAPRYFIEHYLGSETLGYFAALTYFVIVGSMVVNSLAQTVRPRLAKLYGQKNNRDFWRITLIASAIALGIGLCFYLVTITIGEWILHLFYGADFAAYHPYFSLVALASIPVYLGGMWGFVLSSLGEYRVMFYINLAAAVATILVSIWSIPAFGFTGGIIALASLGFVMLCNILPVIFKTRQLA